MKGLLTTTAAGILALGTMNGAMAQQNQTTGTAAPAQAQPNAVQGTTQAATAQGDCQVVQQDFERQVMADPEARAGYTGAMMRDLRMMRDTAWRLEQYGQTEACQRVAEAIREISNDPEAYRDATGRTVGAPGTATTTGMTGATNMGYDQRLQMQREEAVRLSELQGRLRVEELIGTDVRGAEGDSIGEVDDVVLDTAAGDSYLVITYGGFLGMGEDASAVPLSSASISPDRNVVFVDMTEQQLENAPTFDRGDYAWAENDEWLQENRSFYQSN